MRLLNLIVTISLILFYLLALIIDRFAGGLYIFLALLACIYLMLLRKEQWMAFKQLNKKYWVLVVSMCSLLLATLIHSVGTGQWASRSFDSPLRLALFSLILWLFQLLPLKYLRPVQWAIVGGAILAVIKIYILTKGGTIRYGTDFIPIIIFGELAFLLGAFATFSIDWNGTNKKWKTALKLFALLCGFYAAYMSLSRGVWASIPVVLSITYFLWSPSVKIKVLTGAAGLFVVMIIGIFSFNSSVQDRIATAKNDIIQYENKTNVDTSLGLRFQVWHGSFVLFEEHPLFGVGAENYVDALGRLRDRNVISDSAATLPHAHNEVLFMMAKLGIFGLFSILSLYLAPAYYFASAICSTDLETRSAAAMGLALCTGFFMLGLVDVLFLWWEIFPFYAISIAFFLSVIIRRRTLTSSHGTVPNGNIISA